MQDAGFVDPDIIPTHTQEEKKWHGAAVKDLKLPTPVTVPGTETVGKVVDIMKRRGFDQIPVVNDKKLPIGLVSIGNLLSHLTSGRSTPSDPVAKVMFHFSTKREFQEITPETPLANLKQFFELNSIALITNSNSKEIVGVCTQIDLLNYLVAHPNSLT
jgi:cystathionine beta-synthase